MKKTSLLITTGFAVAMAASSTMGAGNTPSDSYDKLQDDIIDFKDQYIAEIKRLAEGSDANQIKIKPLIGTIETACGDTMEILFTQEEFLGNCLEGIKATDEAFNVQGVLDTEKFKELEQRHAFLKAGSVFVPRPESQPEENTPSISQFTPLYETSVQTIDAGCPGSFLDFDNVTSPSCVAVLTQITKDAASVHKDLGGDLTKAFDRICLNNLTVEIPAPKDQDPHGPWFNELYDVTQCLNEFNTLRYKYNVIPANEVQMTLDLSKDVIKAYEHAYKDEYPNEDWGKVPPASFGQSLDLKFDR